MVIKKPLAKVNGDHDVPSTQRPRRLALTNQPPSERIVTAPPVALILAASLPILFWLQTTLPDGGLSLAFSPASLWKGDWPRGTLS